ncbi:MAG: hypothetical protein HYV42_01170 [Candidatus Magasanikbacteria bacterium]|nr:hypothetical protein [Candidatus Magasanikbacteria bacterium]
MSRWRAGSPPLPTAGGFPTITHGRGLAGYPFRPNESVLTGVTPEEFVASLERLQSFSLRQQLSQAAVALATKLFSQEVLDNIVRTELEQLLLSADR